MNRLLLLLFGAVTFVAHAQVPDYVPTEGLVGWWPLEGNAEDAHQNMNGVVYGASEGIGPNDSPCLNFDGVDDYVEVPTNPTLESIEDELTISCWFLKSNSTNSMLVVKRNFVGNPNGERHHFEFAQVTQISHDRAFHFSSYDNSDLANHNCQVWTNDDAFDYDVWTHASVTFANGLVKFFVDGFQIHEHDCGFQQLPPNNHWLNFARMHRSGGVPFSGELEGGMQNVGIWNRALTEEEIFELYNAELPVPGCIDPTACNFVAEATVDDGSCVFPIEPCYNCAGQFEIPLQPCLYVQCPPESLSGSTSTTISICIDANACNYSSCEILTGINWCCDTWMENCVYAPEGISCEAYIELDSDEDGIPNVDEIAGCTYIGACNYLETATDDNGQCVFPDYGYDCYGACLNDEDGDGVCDVFEIVGCQDSLAINFHPDATEEGVCIYPEDVTADDDYCGEGTLWSPTLQQCIPDPMCLGDLNGDGIVGTSDLLSLLSLFGMNCSVTGCVLPFASNYNAEASEDDWSCIIEGCADANALNYVPSVNTPADSSCIYSTTESTGACLGLSTLEYFGYHYPLVEIGSKCWFKENLRTSYFSDSTAIALADGNGNWNTDPEPASTYGGGGELTAMTFGLLYNWYAKSDSRGICPVGWHPADSSAWNEAIELAGGSSLGAPAMRVPGNQITGDGIWEMNNDNSTNATGFSALPAGYRLPNGNFGGVYATGQFWGGESISTGNARSYYLNQSLDLIGITQNNKSVGLAIRCVLQPVFGCTDPSSCNFNPEANQDDGSCELGEYFVEDCMCWFACGDDEPIDDPTGPCSWIEISGCTDPTACNFSADVCDDDGSCVYAPEGCDCWEGFGCCCPGDCNYPDCLADGDGVCGCDEIGGCTDPAACNYDVTAEDEDGSCFYATEYSDCDGSCLCGGEIDVDGDCVCEIFGCTDWIACNYDPNATSADGSCEYAALGYDCDGNCLIDTDGDGICCEWAISGCTDEMACNFAGYYWECVDEDGSCYYPEEGLDCDGNCLNDPDGDGMCWDGEVQGCTDELACNYNAYATESDYCIYPQNCDYCSGDFDGTGVVIDGDADDDGVCDIDEISGCQDTIACNYNAYGTDPYDEGCIYATDPCDTCSGQVDGTGTVISNDADGDGVCDADEVFGCTNPEFCCVYNEFATEDDGSCPDNGYNCDVICCTSDVDSDGICDEDEISGCMDPSALNYDPNATDDSGGCQYE